jgi:FkbM family methyltransferase
MESLVIDLGANKGAFSKEMNRLFRCKCYCIEPNPELYEQLLNDKLNAFNYAITAANGPVEFYISTNPEASSLINNFENVWGLDKKITVEGISFQNLLRQLNIDTQIIEILKIDIEGAEIALIEGFTDDDVKNIRQITIEFHDWLNKDLHIKTVAAIKKLVSLGFTAYTDTPHHGNAVEMLFLNQKLVELDFRQQFNLWIFKRFAFLNYN